MDHPYTTKHSLPVDPICSYVPIYHLDTSLSFTELCALYAVTDVALVTSLVGGSGCHALWLLLAIQLCQCTSMVKSASRSYPKLHVRHGFTIIVMAQTSCVRPRSPPSACSQCALKYHAFLHPALHSYTHPALQRDGMNLVSYEYVACQSDNAGVLVLSEFAGVLKYGWGGHREGIAFRVWWAVRG